MMETQQQPTGSDVSLTNGGGVSPAGSGDPTIIVYQNYYRTEQISRLDPDFTPHDWTHDPRFQFYELAAFLSFYQAGGHLATDYSGIVSWKFSEKTSVTGARFKEFIRSNPGFDVYFINPFPHEGYKFYNVWTQGEWCHPGIVDLAQDLLDRAGHAVKLKELGRNAHDTLLYCNYWVGNKRFWDAYVRFVNRLAHEITVGLSKDERSRYLKDAGYHEPTPFIPFIFERMFSTLLLTDKTIRGCPFSYSVRENRQRYRARDDYSWDMLEPMVGTIDKWDRLLAEGKMDSAEHRARFENLVARRPQTWSRFLAFTHKCVKHPTLALHSLGRQIRRLAGGGSSPI